MTNLLKLYSKDSNEFLFYQYINEKIVISKGDIIEYTKGYFELLNKENQLEFVSLGLTIGKYICINLWIEENETLGEIQQIFLKPIIE
jgi:hypothetical protein